MPARKGEPDFKERAMSQYKFAEVPSNDTIASVVTLLVCAGSPPGRGDPGGTDGRAAGSAPRTAPRSSPCARSAVMQDSSRRCAKTVTVVASRGGQRVS
jgi:hypothetical protein